MVRKGPLMLLPHNDCLHYVVSNSVLYIFTFDELCQYRLPVVELHKKYGKLHFDSLPTVPALGKNPRGEGGAQTL